MMRTFTDAANFLAQKHNIPSGEWSEIWQQQHDTAFTVAGVMNDDLLGDLKNAVIKAQAAGKTLEDFRGEFDDIIAKRGWFTDKLKSAGYKRWRTRVIYDTNLRQSYSAGKLAQAKRLDRKYARYVAIQDDRGRKTHQAWHGTILPIDDPWWDTHTPMNGWGCRCYVSYLTKAQAQFYLGDQDPDAQIAPPIQMHSQSIRLKSGEVKIVTTPKGISPGFNYNPGASIYNAKTGAVTKLAPKVAPVKSTANVAQKIKPKPSTALPADKPLDFSNDKNPAAYNASKVPPFFKSVKVTAHTSSVLEEYTGITYKPINQFFRGELPKSEITNYAIEDIRRVAPDLDKAFLKQRLTHGIVVNRFLKLSDAKIKSLKVRGDFTDKSFASTAATNAKLDIGDTNVRFIITVNKGDRALRLREDFSAVKGETEILLPPSKYKISKMIQGENGLEIYAEVTNQTTLKQALLKADKYYENLE